ncbi:hypothetical protein J6590_002786 [Homalodisca vitripennis]|nr:hypothetical protein J6590_002786 [Homalodisca vitripennis]
MLVTLFCHGCSDCNGIQSSWMSPRQGLHHKSSTDPVSKRNRYHLSFDLLGTGYQLLPPWIIPGWIIHIRSRLVVSAGYKPEGDQFDMLSPTGERCVVFMSVTKVTFMLVFNDGADPFGFNIRN